MATITYRRPVSGKGVLKPGKGEWVQLGQSNDFLDGAIAVTATPYHGTGGTTHVLKVENINITCSNRGSGLADTFHAGCSVVNNGKTTIDSWAVAVGVIKA